MNTYIFQGNPDLFPVDAYLKTNVPLCWDVKQENLAPDMKVGNRVYIWRSKGSQPKAIYGIVACGRLIDSPTVRPDDQRSIALSSDSSGSYPALRVGFQLDRIAESKEMIKSDWLEDDPVLYDL